MLFISLASSFHCACSDELSWDSSRLNVFRAVLALALLWCYLERAWGGFSLAMVHGEMTLLLASLDPGASHMVIIA